jgi:hypothetical protein
MFIIEIGAPILIFAPRRIRFIGATSIILLQILILLTGNYTFFNFLTLALCLLLLDDFVLKKFLPLSLAPDSKLPKLFCWPRAATIPVAAVFIAISLFQIAVIFGVWNKPWGKLFAPIVWADGWLSPFRTVNDYGLFRVMTTERNEIIVQGSNDGAHWLDYEFKYKPGDVNRRPGFVAPFQPRVDWQMWFAAFSDYHQNPWFGNFCVRLLQGSPEVLELLAKNPFPDKPPHYIRAELYNYQFTSSAERRATGAWWKRELIGEYLPPVSLPE